MRKVLVIILFLFSLSPAFSSEKQKTELNKLFGELKKLNNSSEAKVIENKIWKLWTTHPSEQSLTNLLAKGSSYMSQDKLTSAHNVFSKAIELDPNWAEAWNKRATVLYLMGNYELSQKDIDVVLNLEKRHFGALSGQGLVQTALQNYEKAIESYTEAHRIYPAMITNLIMIEKLKTLIQQESI